MLGLNDLENYHLRIPGNPKHAYYYNIFSNIHFGYVGSAIGFPDSHLKLFAAQDSKTDPIDDLTVQIGIDLWRQFGHELTCDQILQAIPARKPEFLAAQETKAYRDTLRRDDPDWRHLKKL